MEGVETSGDSTQGKRALSTPTAFRSQLSPDPSVPSYYATVDCALWLQRVGVTPVGRIWELSAGTIKTTKNLTPFSRTWYKIKQPRPHLRVWVWFPEKLFVGACSVVSDSLQLNGL